MSERKIGFIGCGKMATAIATGIVGRGLVPVDQLAISDPSEDSVGLFQEQFPASRRFGDNQQLVDNADVVVLAVKPQLLEQALQGGFANPSDKLWLSVVAGVSTSRLIPLIGSDRIVRVMPNTPCLIGQGALGIAAKQEIAASDMDFVKRLFGTLGTCVEVREDLLDAVTGLSGSGPAYVFTLIEALIDGGVLMGLARPDAATLAVATVRGAAALVSETGKSPGDLKGMVTSPGGTTIAGLKALEDGGFRGTVMNAVQAAANRARELGGPS